MLYSIWLLRLWNTRWIPSRACRLYLALSGCSRFSQNSTQWISPLIFPDQYLYSRIFFVSHISQEDLLHKGSHHLLVTPPYPMTDCVNNGHMHQHGLCLLVRDWIYQCIHVLYTLSRYVKLSYTLVKLVWSCVGPYLTQSVYMLLCATDPQALTNGMRHHCINCNRGLESAKYSRASILPGLLS